MFNRVAYWNSRPDGVGVLEVADGGEARRFVPLRHTAVGGEIAGPLLAGGGTALAGPGGLIGAFAVLFLAYCVVLFRDAGPRLVPAPAHAI